MMQCEGHVIGIDAGTDAIAVLVVGTDGCVLGTGDAKIPMIKGDDGSRMQDPQEWKRALKAALAEAYAEVRQNFIHSDPGSCLGICPSGQMHGLGMCFGEKGFTENVPLWCDAGSKAEAKELTKLFGHHVAQRLLISRWLEMIRKNPELACQVDFLTVPSGVIAWMLDPTIKQLGYGDACGAFPVNPLTGKYYDSMIEAFDELTKGTGVRSISLLLPDPVTVGTIVGRVCQEAADYFGLIAGTPIFAPEGDQPTTFAGCRVYRRRQVCFSGGTSCCWNLIADGEFTGSHPGVEPFLTPDGKRSYMCHIQNGTPPMNTIVESYGGDFEDLMMAAAVARTDCDGLIVVPTMEPEHGLSLFDQAHAAIFNLTRKNYTPGNLTRAAFVGSMFGALYSVLALREQNIMADEITVSGGIAKSDWTLQVIADVFNTPVRVWGEASQGSAFGAALMALFGVRAQEELTLEWPAFLEQMSPKDPIVFQPDRENVATYQRMFRVYRTLIDCDYIKALNQVPWVK